MPNWITQRTGLGGLFARFRRRGVPVETPPEYAPPGIAPQQRQLFPITHGLPLTHHIPAQVFISYAREDKDWVEHLAGALEENGFDVVWDRERLGGGHFSPDLEGVLDLARCVVVVWSRRSAASHWVRGEAAAALEQSKLIAVVIERGAAPPQAFRHIETLDLSGWDCRAPSEAVGCLAACLERRVGVSF